MPSRAIKGYLLLVGSCVGGEVALSWWSFLYCCALERIGNSIMTTRERRLPPTGSRSRYYALLTLCRQYHSIGISCIE